MAVPLLSDLREPPIVGRYYMVPVVTYRLHGYVQDWPVLGPLHHDREHIGFKPLHYHVDKRFLGERQLRLFETWESVDRGINARPISEPLDYRTGEVDLTFPYGKLPRRPTLKRLKCKREIQTWTAPEATERWGLPERYGRSAEAIRIKGGRLLCPHRKLDLSTLVPDEDGIVTCPLHGLRVRCRPAAGAPA